MDQRPKYSWKEFLERNIGINFCDPVLDDVF